VKRPLAAALSTFAVAGLVVCGASVAHAADDDTVVYTSTYIETQDDLSAFFTTVDPATLDETVLTANPFMTGDDDIWLTGIDIYSGTGYAIRGLDGGEEDIFTWNIATGAQTTPIALNYTDAGFFGDSVDFIETWALDSTTDGRILAIGFFDDGLNNDDSYHHAVIQVDPATGAVTPVVDLTTVIADDTFWYEGVATNPISGTTYVLGYHYESGEANEYPAIATPVDLDANTVGSPITLPAYPSYTVDDIEDGDFDEAGVLYVLSDDNVLGRFAAPLSTGSAFANLGSPALVYSTVVAVTGSAATTPSGGSDGGLELAPTGATATPLALGGLGALMAGGLALALVARRRKRA
jgi:hypothetical protein